MRDVLFVGITTSLAQRSPTTSLLWCGPTTPFHLKKYLILNFYQTRLPPTECEMIMVSRPIFQVGRNGGMGQKAAPHAHNLPHHSGSASDSGSTQNTENEVSLAYMFPVGIIERTCDQWKIVTMTLWQLPYPSKGPLPRHFLGFLLCTLCPCSSSTGSVSSCLCIAYLTPLYGLLSLAVCLSLHPGGDKQMPAPTKTLILSFTASLTAAKSKKTQDLAIQRIAVLTFKVF